MIHAHPCGARQPSQARRPGRRARTQTKGRKANFVELLGKASGTEAAGLALWQRPGPEARAGLPRRRPHRERGVATRAVRGRLPSQRL